MKVGVYLSPRGWWFRQSFQCVVPTWDLGLVDVGKYGVHLLLLLLTGTLDTSMVLLQTPCGNDPTVCLASVREGSEA